MTQPRAFVAGIDRPLPPVQFWAMLANAERGKSGFDGRSPKSTFTRSPPRARRIRGLRALAKRLSGARALHGDLINRSTGRLPGAASVTLAAGRSLAPRAAPCPRRARAHQYVREVVLFGVEHGKGHRQRRPRHYRAQPAVSARPHLIAANSEKAACSEGTAATLLA
jgi:hypothetical protein